MTTAPAQEKPKALRSLPAGIWILGFGSMFMDISTEMIHSLLPLYMASVLGASVITIGFIEGVAEATAAMTRVFSGVLSDWVGRRKWLLVAGYSLAAIMRPVFPLAGSIGWVFGARFVDRIGKGIRGAPRDALIADIAPPRLRGAAYGLRQALDSTGAFAGPLIALLLMIALAGNIRSVMWFAVIPAFITVALIIFFLREPAKAERSALFSRRLHFADAKRLPRRYWLVVSFGAVLMLARFSEAFLVLRASHAGLANMYVPGVMVAMNATYATFAYPAGAAADRGSRRRLLIIGLGMLVAADLLLAAAASPLLVIAGAGLWGLHMAFSEGIVAKLVADEAPPDLRGSAFGIFDLVRGSALLLASVLAGVLWSRFGPQWTFIAGAVFASLAALGLGIIDTKKGTTGSERHSRSEGTH